MKNGQIPSSKNNPSNINANQVINNNLSILNDKVADVKIKKFFDLKVKKGAEMKYIHLDEQSNFKNLYFLNTNKLYKINFKDKKIRECDIGKSKEIIYITGNSSNDSLICIFKNGKIIAVDPDFKIKTYSNINMLNFICNQKKQINLDHFNFYINNFLDKIVFETESSIVVWYKNKFIHKKNDNSEISGTFFNLNKQVEMSKAHIDIKNTTNPNKSNFTHISTAMSVNFSNNFYLGSHAKIFFVITETKLTTNQTKLTIIDYLFQFDYNCKFRCTPYNANQINYDSYSYQNFYDTEEIEDLTDIKTKISNCYLNLFEGEILSTLKKQKVLVQSNMYGNCLAICLNFNIIRNTIIVFYMTETYKFTSHKLSSLLGMSIGMNVEISQIDWISNDMFLIILFNTGAFCILNVNFQVILLTDITRSVVPYDNYYIPLYYNINKLTLSDNIKLVTSKQRDDMFFIFSNLYIVCYQVISKTFENKLINNMIPISKFDDFLFELKYYQLYLSTSDIEVPPEIDISMNVFDLIHRYLKEMLSDGVPGNPDINNEMNDLSSYGNNINMNNNENYNKNIDKQVPNKENKDKSKEMNKEKNEKNDKNDKKNNNNKLNTKNMLTSKPTYSLINISNNALPVKELNNQKIALSKDEMDKKNKTVNKLMHTFVKFIRIFRSINLLHETNLTIIAYFIGTSYDFFMQLINHKEIWLAVLLVELCEKYLCENLRLVPGTTKIIKFNKSLTKNIKGNVNYDDLPLSDEESLYTDYTKFEKSNKYKLLFKPNNAENLAFDSFKFFNPKILYSHMRLVLIFFSLFEFRNNFSNHISVLYFPLAKVLTKKLKQYDLLDELLNVSKIIVKNYKYLVQENDKIGRDEYVLNTISMSYKNEIFTNIHISENERYDLFFDYFPEFYSIDEFVNFVEPSKNYIRNESAELAKEFNYLNHIGQLQKWIIYFNNCLYWELFSDLKSFLDNHFRQMSAFNKNEFNTSPEEKTLSRLIYFNINFFMKVIRNILKYLLKFFTQKSHDSLDNPFVYNNLNLLNDYNKILFPIISPVEIPFLIFEFYIETTDSKNKSLPFEIDMSLDSKIANKASITYMNMDDIFYFIEFLISYNFKFDINNVYKKPQIDLNEDPNANNINGDIIIPKRSEGNNNCSQHQCSNSNNEGENENDQDENSFHSDSRNSCSSNSNNSNLNIMNIDYNIVKKKIQNYIFSAFLFYFMIIHKLNYIYLLDTEKDLMLSIIDLLDYNQKREIYEYLFIIVNGQLKYYLKNDSKLNQNDGRYIEIILNFMKIVFYKMLREEPVLVRNKIYDYIRITPNLMKSYLLEGAFYYEYKNFNMLVKDKLFRFSDFFKLPDKETYTSLYNIVKNNIIDTEFNIFDILLNKNNDDSNFKLIKKILYHSNPKAINNEFYNSFSCSLSNLVSLCLMPYYEKDTKQEYKKLELVFSLETNKEYIRKIIYDSLNTNINSINVNKNFSLKPEDSERDDDYLNKLTFNFVSNAVDKIIKGNFENKNTFKFSNLEFKIKLVFSIKTIIIKILHLLNVMYFKFEILTINPFIDKLNYVNILSFCIIIEKNKQVAFESFSYIISFIKYLDLSKIKSDQEFKYIVETLKNIHIISLKYQMNDKMKKQLADIEIKMEKENKNIKKAYINFLNDEFPKLEQIYKKIKYMKSNNFRSFSLLLYCDRYFDNMYKVYDHLTTYLSKNNLIYEEPFKIVKNNYISLLESFYNITGIPVKYFMEFKKTWNLTLNEELYNILILEESHVNINIKSEKSSLIMNKRQRCGVETPRRQRNIINCRRRNSIRRCSIEKLKRSDSVSIREEKIPNNKRKTKGIIAKNKVPKSIPNIKKIDKKMTDSSIDTSIDGNFKYQSINKIIKKIVFNRIRSYSSNYVNISDNSLSEEVNGNEGNIIADNDNNKININIQNITNNNQIKLISIHNTNIQLNIDNADGEDIKEKEKNYDVENNDNQIIEQPSNQLKNVQPLDFVNVSKGESNNGKVKFFSGAIKASSIGQKDINNEIKNVNIKLGGSPKKIEDLKQPKNKLDELSEKLNKYENMAQNLGKLYVNSVYNQSPFMVKKKKK